MRKSLIEKTYEWDLNAAPAALWPILSDTARLNEALGMPLYRIEETFDRESIRRRYGVVAEEGGQTRWEEPQFEWVENGWWRWRRFYDEGPFREMGGVLMLMPTKTGQTRVRYALSVDPNGALGKMLVTTGHLKLASKSFEKLTRQIDAFCRRPIGDFYSNLAARNSKIKAPKLPSPKDNETAILTQFAEWLAVAPRADRSDLRAKRLARCLGITVPEAIKACLTAVKSGDLAMRYSAICPACSYTAAEFETLKTIPVLLSCQRCGVGFRRDLSKGIEVVFSAQGPNEREIGFCGSGPSRARTILVQQNLGAMERRDLEYFLPAGKYRVRSVDGPTSEIFDVERPSRFHIQVLANSITVAESESAFYIENRCKREYAVAIERCDFPDDALSAADLFAEQSFCALMSDHVLPDGDTASIGFGVMLAVGDLAQPLSSERDGAVVEEDDGYRGIVFTSIADALSSAERLAKAHPDARFALDCGPMKVCTIRNRLRYIGTVPDTARTMCLAGHRGVVLTSPRMKEALSAAFLPTPDAD